MPEIDRSSDADRDRAATSLGYSQETRKEPALDVSCSRQFTDWLMEQRVSLAFTTYQAAKLFFVGTQDNGKLSLFKRTLQRCMGMTAHGSSLYVSSLYQLWRFENILPAGATHEGYDRL